MNIRIASKNDLESLLRLYTQLHNNDFPQIDTNLYDLWNKILSDPNHYIVIGEKENNLVSSCVIVIINNLTNKQRPYALIENVVTDGENRRRGYAAKILEFAKNIAVKHNCYKIMLLTGSKEASTLSFYKKAGYNCTEKTGFIQRL